HQDHVHHRLCRGGAQCRFGRAEKRQGAGKTGPLTGIGQRSEQDAGGLIRLRQRQLKAPNSAQASLPARVGADIRTPPNTTFRARSSAGEHYLDMVGVTGSIPVAPTTQSYETTNPRAASG